MTSVTIECDGIKFEIHASAIEFIENVNDNNPYDSAMYHVEVEFKLGSDLVVLHLHDGDIASRLRKAYAAYWTSMVEEMARADFNKHVTDRGFKKVFDEAAIIIKEMQPSYNHDRKIAFSYDHDGVQLEHFGRVTSCLDDYDYFIRRTVVVDGICVYEANYD